MLEYKRNVEETKKIAYYTIRWSQRDIISDKRKGESKNTSKIQKNYRAKKSIDLEGLPRAFPMKLSED